MKKSKLKLDFDINFAREMADAFSWSCGVSSCVYSHEGEAVYARRPGGWDCNFCKKLCRKLGLESGCQGLHSRCALQAQRFGGRYIYFCPLGLSFCASPIMAGGRFAGAITGGPVLISDPEDVLDSETVQSAELSPDALTELKAAVNVILRVSPKRLGHVSRQLFASAVCVSDSSQEIFRSRSENNQQNYIGDYIFRLKTGEQGHSYPSMKEQELVAAIASGDKATAGEKLNELLGHIFFYISDPEQARARMEELFVIMGRAAVTGGADPELIFRISQQHMAEMRTLKTQEAIASYLARSLGRFTDLVFDMVDAKHSKVMRTAIEYINANFARNISLGDVAQHVGYSPAYFSRIFKEEMDLTFKEHLNNIRIEKSKALLLGSPISVAEICHLVGFNDQSYFCKIFRSITGVSPDKYRKRIHRIDESREYGLK